MRSLDLFVHGVDAVNEWLGRTVAWLTLGTVLICFTVVVLRYVFATGIIWLQEAYVWLHAMVFMIGAGYTFKYGVHVRVDIFYGQMSPRRQAWVDIIGTIVFLGPFLFVVAVFSYQFIVSSWAIRETSSQPGGIEQLYLLKSVIWVFVIVVGLQGLALMARRVLFLFGRDHHAPDLGDH